jgi:hypothetical protein
LAIKYFWGRLIRYLWLKTMVFSPSILGNIFNDI